MCSLCRDVFSCGAWHGRLSEETCLGPLPSEDKAFLARVVAELGTEQVRSGLIDVRLRTRLTLFRAGEGFASGQAHRPGRLRLVSCCRHPPRSRSSWHFAQGNGTRGAGSRSACTSFLLGLSGRLAHRRDVMLGLTDFARRPRHCLT